MQALELDLVRWLFISKPRTRTGQVVQCGAACRIGPDLPIVDNTDKYPWVTHDVL
jgi:hypothetical protein